MDATKDAVLAWLNAFFPNSPAPSFETLNDGHHLYRLLAFAANYCFTEDDDAVPKTENWILKKTNLGILVRDMSRFGSVFLKANDGFDLSNSNTVSLDAIAKGDDVNGLVELAEYVITMAVLSGNSAVIEKLRGLSKERQMALNGPVKRIMTLNGFKKATGASSQAAANNTINTHNQQMQQQQQQQHQSNSNNSHQMTGNRNDDIRSNDDPAVLRAELNVLKNELRDKSSALDTAESKFTVVEQQLEQLQARYRVLLEQSESRAPTTKERELQQALSSVSKKDDEITQLKGMLSDVEAKNKELKDLRRQAEEEIEKMKTTLEAEKKRSKDLIAEKSDAIANLTLAQDRLELVKAKRDEFERELLKKESEETLRRAASSQRLNTSNQHAAGSTLEGSLHVDGMGDVDAAQLGALVADLRAKLMQKEKEVDLLKQFGGDGDKDGVNLSDEENMSNTSMVHAPTTRLGDAPSPSVNNTSVISQGASVVEIAELKAQLIESQNAIKALEARLAEQVDSHKMQLDTYQMKIKQAEDEAATRGAEALQKELDELQQENERTRKALLEANATMARQEEELRTSGAKQLADLQTRLDNGRKAMQAEQAVVTSVVFHCGQRNLSLQQRNLLGGAAVPHAFRDEGYSGLFRQAARSSSSAKNGGGYSNSRGVYEEEMSAAAGGSESFMSTARLTGLWSNMKTGGVPIAGPAVAAPPTKKK